MDGFTTCAVHIHCLFRLHHRTARRAWARVGDNKGMAHEKNVEYPETHLAPAGGTAPGAQGRPSLPAPPAPSSGP